MNSGLPIRTYNDLLLEEQRLTILANWHKDQLKADVQDIKAHLAPVARIASFVGRIAAPAKKYPLLGAGIGVGASLLAEKALARLRPVRWLAGLAGNLFQRLTVKKSVR